MVEMYPIFNLKNPVLTAYYHYLSFLCVFFLLFCLLLFFVFFKRKINNNRKILFQYEISPCIIIGMNLNKNECDMFPVQQIISTSIGAICTALLMVEKKKQRIYFHYNKLLFFF
jgi:hypothetical protein